jgi:hypothetical protein
LKAWWRDQTREDIKQSMETVDSFNRALMERKNDRQGFAMGRLLGENNNEQT